MLDSLNLKLLGLDLSSGTWFWKQSGLRFTLPEGSGHLLLGRVLLAAASPLQSGDSYSASGKGFVYGLCDFGDLPQGFSDAKQAL